jgi:chemotaxis protein CheD
MGELAAGQSDGVLRTLLGSCIGLALYDRRRKVGGLAHVVLPESRGATETPGKFIDTAIPALMERMAQLAGEQVRPSARIAGGAAMFATHVTISVGEQNIHAAEHHLALLRIPIIARHCGGTQGRRMSLDLATGVVTIEVVGSEPVQI